MSINLDNNSVIICTLPPEIIDLIRSHLKIPQHLQLLMTCKRLMQKIYVEPFFRRELQAEADRFITYINMETEHFPKIEKMMKEEIDRFTLSEGALKNTKANMYQILFDFFKSKNITLKSGASFEKRSLYPLFSDPFMFGTLNAMKLRRGTPLRPYPY